MTKVHGILWFARQQGHKERDVLKMSLYQFFASDKVLKEYDNNAVYYDEKKDIIISSEHSINASLRIIKEDNLYYAKIYTKKTYCAYVEWYYSDKNARIIVEYIKEHLKEGAYSMELWNAWEYNDTDEKNKEISQTSKKEVHIKDLTIQHIKDIWGQSFYYHPACLKIFKTYKYN